MHNRQRNSPDFRCRNIYSRAFAAYALAWACLLAPAWLVRAEPAAEVRTWTSSSGQKDEAQFIRLDGTTVVLRNNAKGEKLVKRSNLSAQDNAYLDKVAPASVSDMLIGEWWGWQTPDRPWQFKLTITRAGNRLVGKGYVRRCMTEAQSAAALAKRLKKVEASKMAALIECSYDISVTNDTVTLVSKNLKDIFSHGDIKLTSNTYTGVFKQPGILAGEWSAEGVNGLFRLAKKNVLDTPLPLELEKGRVHKDITPFDGGPYHYSLYIPKSYDHQKPAPLLVNLSPGANAAPLSTSAAEKHGWIMIGIKENSNNASWDVNHGSVMTGIFDCMRRFNVHKQRIYFSGLSGGSRRASSNVSCYPDFSAGAICIGAGYLYNDNGEYYVPDIKKPIFFITGTNDNVVKDEVIRLHKESVVQKRVTMIATHDKGHSWGPPELHEQAVDWFENLCGKSARK
jgi:hypothetical protein